MIPLPQCCIDDLRDFLQQILTNQQKYLICQHVPQCRAAITTRAGNQKYNKTNDLIGGVASK